MAVAAQLTDLHLGDEADPLCRGSMARFEACIDSLMRLIRPPDLYVVSGDIAEHGDAASYERFFAVMRQVERPFLWICGNHDDAATFAAAAAQVGCATGHDEAEVGGWRFLGADTSLAGRQDGYFDEARAAHLDRRLSERRDVPTILAIHHPPVTIGLDWLDPAADAPWTKLLGDVLSRHPQVKQIVCGHVHMAAMTRFRGIPVSIAPAVSSQIWPELAAMDRARPDGRMLVIDGVPGFALHRLGAHGVDTIFGSPPIGEVRLRYDHRLGG